MLYKFFVNIYWHAANSNFTFGTSLNFFFSLNIFNPSLVESTDVDLWIQKVKSIYFLYPNRYSKVI